LNPLTCNRDSFLRFFPPAGPIISTSTFGGTQTDVVGFSDRFPGLPVDPVLPGFGSSVGVCTGSRPGRLRWPACAARRRDARSRSGRESVDLTATANPVRDDDLNSEGRDRFPTVQPVHGGTSRMKCAARPV
jgi:hypothetical protein